MDYMDYLDVLTGTIAIIFGLITIVTVYRARLKYYRGPWKSVVVWMMWGVAISLSRVLTRYAEVIITPEIEELPTWLFFVTNILSFFCFMNAGFEIKNMAGLYSAEGYGKLADEIGTKVRKKSR